MKIKHRSVRWTVTYCWGLRSRRALSWPLRSAGRSVCGRAVWTWWPPSPQPWSYASALSHWAPGGRWWRRPSACKAVPGPLKRLGSWRWWGWSSGCTADTGSGKGNTAIKLGFWVYSPLSSFLNRLSIQITSQAWYFVCFVVFLAIHHLHF